MTETTVISLTEWNKKTTEMQQVTFYAAKGNLLERKMPSFATRKTAFYNALVINMLRMQQNIL